MISGDDVASNEELVCYDPSNLMRLHDVKLEPKGPWGESGQRQAMKAKHTRHIKTDTNTRRLSGALDAKLCTDGLDTE